MIIFDHINKIFKSDLIEGPVSVLKDVSFEISEGSVIGFLGANGAGKTTSLKILMNFIEPTSGKVHFDQSLGSNQQEIFSNIGYLPERPYFYPYLTGMEFVNYMGRLNDLSSSIIKEKGQILFERLKLSHAMNRKIRDYSKGMLQRLGFISTLLHDPKIILLDEPLSGLDPIGRKEFKDIILELNSEGKTIFFSSHIVSDVEEVCQKVVVLEQGKTLYDGSINALVEKHSSKEIEVTLSSKLDETYNEYLKISNNNFSRYIFPQNIKYDVLSKAQELKLDIHNLHLIKPSLEEIIYKSGGSSE